MNFFKPMLRTLLVGAFAVSLLTSPLRVSAETTAVDGQLITAEDKGTSSPAPARPSAFSGRLLTAADLRADQ